MSSFGLNISFNKNSAIGTLTKVGEDAFEITDNKGLKTYYSITHVYQINIH